MEQSDRIMRRNRKLALALAAAWVLAVLGSLAADRFPLNRAFLQSHLDGNQKDGTNFGTLAATNFAGNGAGLTNVPLSALAQSGADTNQVPKWNGVAWAPGTVSDGFDWTNVWQYGSANLTNWSALGTNAFEWRYQAGDADLTNWAKLATNAFEWRYQAGDATLTNLAGLDSASDGQVIKWSGSQWAVGNDLTGGEGSAYYGPFTNLTVYEDLWVTHSNGTGIGVYVDGTNGSLKVGDWNSVVGGRSLAVGDYSIATGPNALAVGGSAYGQGAVALGGAIAEGAGAFAAGPSVVVSNGSWAIGTNLLVTGKESLAFGNNLQVSAPMSLAFGNSIIITNSAGVKGRAIGFGLGQSSGAPNVLITNAQYFLVNVSDAPATSYSDKVIKLVGDDIVLYARRSAIYNPAFYVDTNAFREAALVLTNASTGTEVFSVSTNGQVTASGYVGDGSGLTNLTVVELLDCTSAEVVRELTNRAPHVLVKSNANYNALIVANGQTNTVTGALVWVDAQPLGTTNWVIRW